MSIFKRFTRKTIGHIAVFSVVALCAGCSLIPNKTEIASDGSTLIAKDFIGVLRQIEQLDPSSTVLWVPMDENSDERFATALVENLQSAGYALRIEGTRGNALPVEYSVANQLDQDGNSTHGAAT